MANGPAAREPEIYREQQTLSERIETMDKCCEELRSEIGQMESTLRIALRPEQDRPKQTSDARPDPPPPLTQMGDAIRSTSDKVIRMTRMVSDMSERLRDIRDRCELPRLPEVAQAVPIYDQKY